MFLTALQAKPVLLVHAYNSTALGQGRQSFPVNRKSKHVQAFRAIWCLLRKTSTSALLTTPMPLTVDHNKLWTILKDVSTRPPYLSPEKPTRRLRSKS